MYNYKGRLLSFKINRLKEATMFICPCGFNGNAAHTKKCAIYKNEVDRLTMNIEKYIVAYYDETCSITECIGYVKKTEKTVLGAGILRKIITNLLDTANKKKPFNDAEVQRKNK